MFIDSHCHINFPELAADLDGVAGAMASNRVTHALCVSVNLETFPQILAIAQRFPNIFASVGVHPDERSGEEPDIARLVGLAGHRRVVAIGETGLDYYRVEGNAEWQRERFRTHIRAARQSRKPLIIHTRDAPADTLRIMKEEGAQEIGGVMHCFTETADVARRAMDLNFMISFSGIVTFKNAATLKDVAREVPLDRMLIETDSPYLAPVPYRGRTNQPAYVRFVAEEIARLKGVPIESVAEATTANFFRLFNVVGTTNA
ncbi:MAG TPA: TatD family hydrolase [Burkholderiales bacterium]|nr:TatD family hydrolase [Burkholderiales bacterium]